MAEEYRQLRAATVTSALDGAGRDVEDCRRLVDGHALEIDQHDGQPLIVGEPRQRVGDLHDRFALRDVVARVGYGGERFGVVRHHGANPATAHSVEAGIDDDPVQPGRELCVATEARRLPERGQERVLNGVLGLVGIAEGTQRHGPGPVPMPRDENAEGPRVAVDVAAQQGRVVDVVDIGREIQGRASRGAVRCGEPSAAPDP